LSVKVRPNTTVTRLQTAIPHGKQEYISCFNADIIGPTFGLPDGKVDKGDLVMAAKNYGKIDHKTPLRKAVSPFSNFFQVRINIFCYEIHALRILRR